jgi:hypothetical protein
MIGFYYPRAGVSNRRGAVGLRGEVGGGFVACLNLDLNLNLSLVLGLRFPNTGSWPDVALRVGLDEPDVPSAHSILSRTAGDYVPDVRSGLTEVVLQAIRTDVFNVVAPVAP